MACPDVLRTFELRLLERPPDLMPRLQSLPHARSRDIVHMLAGLALLIGAVCSCEASPFLMTVGDALYTFDPDRIVLQATINGRTVPVLRSPGPAWSVGGSERSPLNERCQVVSTTDENGGARIAYTNQTGKVRWRMDVHAGAHHEIVFRLSSDDPRIAGAQPGHLTTPGEWIALDLSQNQLAHGQPYWVKTYYLREQDVFLCAWWDWATSNATRPDWPVSRSDLRMGRGPCAPAASMKYVAGPDGKRAPLRDALHVRIGRRLWEVALPSLCRASEYRDELAQMIYLDFWGGRTAAHTKYVLERLKQLAYPHVRLLSVVQNWQAGGFDALLPDSIWLPEYPPSPAVGTVDELREVAELGNSIGRMAFRTNYAFWREGSPSYRRGLVGRALKPDGKPKWHTQPSRWTALAQRQENEIAQLWRPTAAFVDQLASGGGPQAYTDFSRAADGTLSAALRHQRALARLMKQIHRGPLGSEKLNQQDLVGYYCDFGDYSILAGHNRLFPVDYKLRRMHPMAVSYGCGLTYRFFELPPFKRFHRGELRLWDAAALMDHYRCCEVLLGNGAYVFWRAPWPWTLTECLVVGRLQRHYALASVESIEYLRAGQWQTLESMVRSGFAPQTRPWNQKQPELGRVRIRYDSGLTVVVNRLAEARQVKTPSGTATLPQYGWVAFKPNSSVQAYSAHWPGTQQRVDFIEDRPAGLRFLNPRGAAIEGSTSLRFWREGRLLWSVDPVTDTVTVAGRELALNPPEPPPLTDLHFDFSTSLCGMRPTAGILRVEPTNVGQRLTIVTHAPQLRTPPLALRGSAADVLELTMSADAGKRGKLYFATPDDGISERQVVRFRVEPDGKPHTIGIPIGKHPRWAGAQITGIRLDPIHGSNAATLILRSLRLVRK